MLDAATALLAETGDGRRVAMRDVAAGAGVTPPAIYRLFPDKAALLRAAIAEQFAAFDRFLDDAAAPDTPPRARLERRCVAYLQYAETNPGHYRVLFSATHLGPDAVGPTEPHPGSASFARLVDAVTACLQDDPTLARYDSTAFELAVQLWALLHGVADLQITKPEFPWPDTHALVLDGLHRLLRRP